MDSFILDLNTDSNLTNGVHTSPNTLDWTAFQSAPPPPTTSSSTTTTSAQSPFSPLWLSQHDDAVAPNNQSTLVSTLHEEEIYGEIEHFFNGLNQQQQQTQSTSIQSQGIIEPIHVNITIPDQTMNDREHLESSNRAHLSLVINERPMSCLPTPLVPRVSSSRSQCYHKLPDRAVKLMQEWYNANLDDPYPRSPDKKRFITEGNITAQQCRSWFANRRQRLKHVKRNLSKGTSSRYQHSFQTRLSRMPSVETQSLPHEHCYYCQQQQQQQQLQNQPTVSSFPSTTTTTATTTTLNVVINQQTVEQLIHNSLRKLLYPSLM